MIENVTNYGGDMWTTRELAARAEVTDAYIRALLIDGKIDGEKFGHIWAIPDDEAKRWLSDRGIHID